MKLPTSPCMPIILTAPPVTIQLKPELIWPSICEKGLTSNDMRKIPTEAQIFNKHGQWTRNEKLFESIEFWESATKAEEIRIIDPHLDIHAIKSIRELLYIATEIKTLKILISSNALSGDIQSVFEDLCTHLKDNGCKGSLELKQSLDSNKYPYLHDRFAVVDGELWHFGATVGGLHHSLNAFSRGWDDNDHNFKNFFEDVWRRY
ncbi:TPA: hypothetical protein ACX6RY_001288 [Photobacterium damselae]